MQDRQYQADMDNARATGAKYRATLDRLTRTLEGLKAQRIRVVATLSTAENIAAKYSSVSSASRTDIQALDAQKPINDAREKLAALDKDIGSTESSFAEQNAFEAKDVADRQSKIADEIKAALTELRPLQGKLEQLQHGITKTVIRAPVDGRISKRIVNVGSGVTPSSHAFEITPNAAELTIQANFRDKDIDALHKALHRDGQAKIDVGGYDHLKWGRLTGTVVTVCSAAVEDKTKQQGGGWSCPVEIKVTSPVTNLGKQLALRSGMTATVHVHGDSRTVWDYLTADFRATADRFGTERGS